MEEEVLWLMELWQIPYEHALSIPAALRFRLFTRKEEIERDRRKKHEQEMARARTKRR